MKRSTDRIITTHVGSLPRPHDLLDVLSDKINGKPYDAPAFDERVKRAIDDVVQRQADAGIDVVGDGEQSKAGFFAYVRDRLTGFEPRTLVLGKHWFAAFKARGGQHCLIASEWDKAMMAARTMALGLGVRIQNFSTPDAAKAAAWKLLETE